MTVVLVGGGNASRASRVPAFMRSCPPQLLSNGTDTNHFSITAYKCLVPGVSVECLLTNNTTNVITVKGTVNAPDGSLTPLQVQGRETIVIDAGEDVWAQAQLSVYAGETLKVRLFVEPRDAAGALIASGKWGTGILVTQATLGETVVNGTATDLTRATSGLPASITNGQAYRPAVIRVRPAIGFTVPPIVGVLGDSISIGTGDDQTLVNGPGFICRALAGNYPIVNGGVPGVIANYASSATPAGNTRRIMESVAGCTTVYEALGANNLNVATQTTAELAALKIPCWTQAAAGGARVRTITLFPRNAATNAALRQTFNAWIRAGAPIDPTAKTYVAVGTAGALLMGQAGHPCHGYDEIGDAMETTRDSNTYIATYSTDNVHPIAAGAIAAAAAVNVSAVI